MRAKTLGVKQTVRMNDYSLNWTEMTKVTGPKTQIRQANKQVIVNCHWSAIIGGLVSERINTLH